METIKIRADEAGVRIDSLIAAAVPELSRSAVQRIIDGGGVTLGGKAVKKNYKTAFEYHLNAI